MTRKYDWDNNNELIKSSWRNVDNNSVFREINQYSTNINSRITIKVRDNFYEYFNSEGVIPWQFNHC